MSQRVGENNVWRFALHLPESVSLILRNLIEPAGPRPLCCPTSVEESTVKKSILSVTLVVGIVSASPLAQCQLDQILKKAESAAKSADLGNRGLSNDKIVAGLKQALTLSTGNAVASTGKPDGFLKNEAIKILLPEKLRTLGKGMRLMGMGSQMDELEVGMNRAAEQATPKAKQIFLDAVTRMSFDDARKILSSNDTAATEYFKKQSSVELTTTFAPIVHQSMENVGVVRQYNQILKTSAAAPLLGSQKLNLDNYVVEKTLDGLFLMLGAEEKKIRHNPASQTTALLKEVFGKKL